MDPRPVGTPNPQLGIDQGWMAEALEIAQKGRGWVEPNPMVGCVLVRDGIKIAQGFHARFGDAHAEVRAIEELKISQGTVDHLSGVTVYVTLEPCSHYGKTPPCVDLLCRLKPDRVVVGLIDPFPDVAGRGVARLLSSGIPTDVGVLQAEIKQVVAPYLKRIRVDMPWVIAKWAMTLDGKIASRSGHSQWISNESSRQEVHRIRGRMDAIIVGIGTAMADDPMLNARLPSQESNPSQATGGLARVARRVVIDSRARLPLQSRLVSSCRQSPVLVWCGPQADDGRIELLRRAGCGVEQDFSQEANERLLHCMHYLSRQGATNVLVEGGANLLGSLCDLDAIDECHVFLSPKMVGGATALSPMGGLGRETIPDACPFRWLEWKCLDGDLYGIARRS